MLDNEIAREPFLKWAGGKRWFTKNHQDFLPSSYNSYIEPFLGSGAVFFNLRPEQAILSDSNKELIDTYRAIQSDYEKVETLLKKHHRNHCKDYYYKVRASKPRSLHGQAANFIYLNRTCWNALYRVNLKGEFNVPVGTKTSVVLSTDNFGAISKLLKDVVLIHSDFQSSIDLAGDGDFVFVDPPYTVKHNNNGFTKYNEKLFTWEDQQRLRAVVDAAVSRGTKVLVTNANHESVRELYDGYEQVIVGRQSVIASKAKYRGMYDELIVRCW